MVMVSGVGVLGIYIYRYSHLEVGLSLTSFGLVLSRFSALLAVVEGVAGVQWDLQREVQRVKTCVETGLVPGLNLPFGWCRINADVEAD